MLVRLIVPTTNMNRNKTIFVLAAVIGVIILAVVGLLIKQTYKPELVTNRQTAQKPSFVTEGTVFSDTSLNNPEIIKLPDGTYRMFFHRVQDMLSAVSTDGKTFVLEKGVRLQGGMPTLITLPNGRYRMYFNTFPDNSIKSAISSNGFDFEIEPGERLSKGPARSPDQGGIIHPSVIRVSDGTYKMYYDGVATNSPQSGPDSWTVMSASSSDGLIWTKDKGARIPTCAEEEENNLPTSPDDDVQDDICLDGAWNVNAVLEKGKVVLYFSANTESVENSGIWKAASDDGLSFTIEGLVLGQEKAYRGKRVESRLGPKGVPQDPFVLELSDGYRLFYWTPEGGILSAFAKK